VIVLNDAHWRRLLRDYISYYHLDRIHGALEKDSPATGAISRKPAPSTNLIPLPRMGSLITDTVGRSRLPNTELPYREFPKDLRVFSKFPS
jgi:hypothetical protein